MRSALRVGEPVGMRGVLTLAAFIPSLVLIASCSGTPSAPGPPPQSRPPAAVPSPPAAVPLPTTAASLVIERISVLVYPQQLGDPFGYEPRFQLRETSGNSGATIQNIFVGDLMGGGDNTDAGCWRATLRVPPGGTLDTFYTDDGFKWLGYCAPSSDGRTQSPELRLVVSFTDDEGRTGTVQAIATVTK
jgi:hypothetical protein